MLIRGSDALLEHGRHGQLKQVLLSGGRLPGVTQIATATLEAGLGVETHSHPTMWEIFYVLEGAAEYFVGTDRYTATTGDLVVVPAGVPHSVTAIEAPHRILYWGIAVD
jgi:quercetin dioxygenase-like cupin family protein